MSAKVYLEYRPLDDFYEQQILRLCPPQFSPLLKTLKEIGAPAQNYILIRNAMGDVAVLVATHVALERYGAIALALRLFATFHAYKLRTAQGKGDRPNSARRCSHTSARSIHFERPPCGISDVNLLLISRGWYFYEAKGR